MIQEIGKTAKIDIQLQFRSKVSLSDQLRRGLFALIERGALPEDTLLPTVRELAAQLGVNFNTVARAYRALDQEGWLITRQGRGTVVSRPEGMHQEDVYGEKIRQLAAEIQRAAEQFNTEPLEVLKAVERQLQSAEAAKEMPHRKLRKKRQMRFREYHTALPKSRKTRRETLDWRLRKPNR